MMGVSLLVTAIDPPRPAVEESDAPEASAKPRPKRPADAPGPPGSRRETISADEQDQRVVVRSGRPLHLVVTASEPGSVQLGEDGPIAAVQPELPARFDLLPDEPGTREIVLLDPVRPIGRLTVRR